jgi:hypothetical protein
MSFGQLYQPSLLTMTLKFLSTRQETLLWEDQLGIAASPVEKSLWILTEAMPDMEVAHSQEKTHPKWTGPVLTRRVGSPKI